ncbi:hypothetical protein BGY98DRAFT_930762 [Russula aff. rugulosa BPL654]|nr:hypothetical protein BGY98DRAFT_930762 [Russula aff. rugulosa BPL654]
MSTYSIVNQTKLKGRVHARRGYNERIMIDRRYRNWADRWQLVTAIAKNLRARFLMKHHVFYDKTKKGWRRRHRYPYIFGFPKLIAAPIPPSIVTHSSGESAISTITPSEILGALPDVQVLNSVSACQVIVSSNVRDDRSVWNAPSKRWGKRNDVWHERRSLEEGLEPLDEYDVARRRRTYNWGHDVFSGKLLHQMWTYEGTKTGSFITTENAQTRHQRTHDYGYKT